MARSGLVSGVSEDARVSIGVSSFRGRRVWRLEAVYSRDCAWGDPRYWRRAHDASLPILSNRFVSSRVIILLIHAHADPPSPSPSLAIRDYWNLGKEGQKDDKYVVLVSFFRRKTNARGILSLVHRHAVL